MQMEASLKFNNRILSNKDLVTLSLSQGFEQGGFQGQDQPHNQQYDASHFGFEEQQQNPFDSGKGRGGDNPFDSKSNRSQKGNPFDSSRKDSQQSQQGYGQANPYDYSGNNYDYEQNNYGGENPFEGGNNQNQQESNGNPFGNEQGGEYSNTNQGYPSQDQWGGGNDFQGDQSNPFDYGGEKSQVQQNQHQRQSSKQIDFFGENNNQGDGYDNQDYNQQQHTQQSQNNNEYGAQGWNDNYDYGNQGGYGDNYGGGDQTSKSNQNQSQHGFNNHGGYGDTNQSYNNGNQHQYGNDQDNYGFNNNYGQNNDNNTRKSSTDFNQNPNNSSHHNRQDSLKDSMYNQSLSDSHYNIVMKKNSAYNDWKNQQQMFDNPNIEQHQENNSVWQQITYDPNMVYDPNPEPQQNADNSSYKHSDYHHNQSLTDVNKNQAINNSMNAGNNSINAGNNSINAGNNGPMHYDDLAGQDNHNNWGTADNDFAQGNNERKESINTIKDQFQENKQDDSYNKQASQNFNGWDNVDFFGEQTQKNKSPSNQQLPNNTNDFAGGDFFSANQKQNTQESQKNDGWGDFSNNPQSNFDQHEGNNTNTNSNQNQNFGFNDDGFKEQNSQQEQTNKNFNNNDFFSNNEFGSAAQTEQPKQTKDNQFEAFGFENFEQNKEQQPEYEKKEYFKDMKQTEFNDDFFNIPSSQNQNNQSFSNHNENSNAAAADNNQNDIFDGFGATPQTQQPNYQQNQHHNGNQQGFDYTNDQIYQSTNTQTNQTSKNQQNQFSGWNQPPDTHHIQESNDQQNFQQGYEYNSQKGKNSSDIFDMVDQLNGGNSNQNKNKQQQQQQPLAQPASKQIGQLPRPYQIGQKMVRDSIQQTTNEFDRTTLGIKTYKVLEVSPEIRKRNEEFYQQLSKEEAIKGYVDDQRKELLQQKIKDSDPEKQYFINKKLEILTNFQLQIIERQNILDQQDTQSVPKPFQKGNAKPAQVFQSLAEAGQKDIIIKEIKDLNDQIAKQQSEIDKKLGEEQLYTRRIDELEKELFNTKKYSEQFRKEFESLIQEHNKSSQTEKELRSQNEKLQRDIQLLNEELDKLRNDNTKILNEVIDPQYFKKSFIQLSPAGPDNIDSGPIEVDQQGKKILNNVRQQYDEYHSVQISRSMREGYKVVEDKIYSASSLDIANKVKNNLVKLLELNYQTSPHRDDALVKMIGAKSNIQKQKEMNKIYFKNQEFKDLIDLQIFSNHSENLDNFKYCCLHQKAILYENSLIQIGVVSNLQSQYPSMIKPGCEIQELTTIKPRSQKKHQIESSQFDIKSQIPLADINIVSQSSNETTRIAIPVTLNKFLIFMPIDQSQFKQRWRTFKTSYVFNEPRDLNERFAKDLCDLKRYFEYMIELNNRKRTAGSQYGVLFRIDGISQFQLKVSIDSQSKITFKIASYDSVRNVEEYLCNYLCFLFTL